MHMTAYVRSWDLVSGFIYDTMVMSMILQASAASLSLDFGDVAAVVASAHVYAEDADKGRLPDDDGIGGRFFLDPSTVLEGPYEPAEGQPMERFAAIGAWAMDQSILWDTWVRRRPPLGVLVAKDGS
jgi:hypothetical protein